MRLALLFNPRSGSGRAQRLADLFTTALAAAGHAVRTLPLLDPHGRPLPPLAPAGLQDHDVLAVVGGDGTIHRAAPIAAAAGRPLYHIPAGTENLFARHYGMTRDPAQLLAALERGRCVPMDVANVAGRPFLLMASIGPDAGVIHRLHGARTGAIRLWSYLRPVLAELIAPRLPLLSVRVDGRPWLESARGLLVVGNSPHYAWRLNPARDAQADDGLLDACFYPADTIADTVHWAAQLMTRRTGPIPGAPTARGARLEVATSTPDDLLLQMDGEAGPAWRDLAPEGRCTFGIGGPPLLVLAPPAWPA